MKRVRLDWAREWMAIVSDVIGIAYHSHLTTVYDHYYGDKGMEFEFTVFLDGGEEVTTTEWVHDVDERMEELREQYGEDCHAVRAKPMNQEDV